MTIIFELPDDYVDPEDVSNDNIDGLKRTMASGGLDGFSPPQSSVLPSGHPMNTSGEVAGHIMHLDPSACFCICHGAPHTLGWPTRRALGTHVWSFPIAELEALSS
jgi:hypothetical protein